MPTVHTEQDYQTVYQLFNRQPQSKLLTINAIKNTVFPLLSKKDSFLDIGAGPGRITDAISTYFKRIVVVEPNQDYANSLRDRHYVVFPVEFQRSNLNEKFDFILCSQVLYHAPIEEWPFFITKMINLLAKGGLVMIVIGAARGDYYEFSQQLNPHYRNSAPLIKFLNDQMINFFLEKKTASYTTDTLDEMYALCRFAVLEGCLTPDAYNNFSAKDRKNLDKKIREFSASRLTPDNHYLLTFERDFIYIGKQKHSFKIK